MTRAFLTLGIIAVGLAGRAVLDKVMALRGGAEAVAAWAQMTSVMELVAGVALAGIGTGISVLVAQTSERSRQRLLLRESVRQGFRISIPAMLLVCAVAAAYKPVGELFGLTRWQLVISALVGVALVVPGMLNGYWIGQQRRQRMLLLAAAGAVLPALVAVTAPGSLLFVASAAAQAVPALVILLVARASPVAPSSHANGSEAAVLRYYLWAGISIGIFSPLSMFVARSVLSSSLSWHEVGQLQALWRSSEWVSGIAAGVMSVYFLPRMSAAVDSPAFVGEVRACAAWTLVPSGIALAVLYLLRKPVFQVLYDASLLPGAESVLVFLVGTWVRIASWVPLFALYALRRTAAVTYGELLSLPLFAAGLAVFAEGMTLERASFLWLAAYLVYALFNLIAIQPSRRTAR